MASYSGTIGASADDAAESGGGVVTIDGAALSANAANEWVGFRFQGVTIPAGSTISAASLDVYLTSGAYDDPDVTIYGEDVDDAAAFVASSNNISGRTLTTASVSWSASGLGTGVKTTPDFKGVIQEIVDRAGWNGGQDMAVIFDAGGSGALRMRAYDAGGGSYAALSVTYTEPSGGAIVPLVVHHFGQQGMN